MEGRSVLLLILPLLQLMLSASADVVPMYPPYTTAPPELLEYSLCERSNQPDTFYESTEQRGKAAFPCKLVLQIFQKKMAPFGICGVPMKILGDLIIRNGGLDQILQNYQGRVNYNPVMLTKCKDLALRDKDKNLLTKIAKSGDAVGEKLEYVGEKVGYVGEKFFDKVLNHLWGPRP